ncbi:isopentenyl-diphosphate delta-isomerase [Aliiroseovarius sediminilitoris]|uniref:Isopentenyl-diphosphate Delta-isomerase n=1 Tax=Aliiroseovarius sediminilitoris TaxID=1173584 RepID=A0A1I0MRS2_9RHOB|nr:isopentenyl-diphosphate delta-isomerase [Aliiroseovarius sediminilitoris]SEV91336.1 isopentenyl-diphosphate delta-isomerase [Aliiroseovarius sediminilitoris]
MTDMIPAWIDGTLTPVEKLHAHVEGMKHKAVSVFLFHADKVLIQQRAAGKYHTPNKWANTCCTHPHWNEDPRDCAIRRLEEELGITGVHPKWVERLEYRADVGGGLIEHEVVDMFVIHTDETPGITLNPSEVQAVQWLDRATLEQKIAATPDAFTPWLKIYMSRHASSVFGPA